MSILKRIEQIAISENITITSLESKIGASKGVLSRALSKDTDIQTKWTIAIVDNYPRYSSEWLLTGKGPMLKDDQTSSPTSSNTIPLVSSEAIAGFGNYNFCILEEDVQEHYVIPDFKDIDFMIRIKGSSMYPKYSSGDIVACRILKDPQFIQWNKTYIIGTNDQGIICKRLLPGDNDEYYKVISDNDRYLPFDLPKSEITGIALIIGVVRME